MRLVIKGFSAGLIDEEAISRMGLAIPESGMTKDEITLPKCPASDVNAMDFYTRETLNKMSGRDNLHTTAWKNSAITRIYQWQNATALDFTLAFSCVSGAVSGSVASVTVSGGSAVFNTVSVSGTDLANWAPGVNDMIDIAAYAGSAVITYGGTGLPLAVYTGSTYLAPILGANSPVAAKCVAAWGSYLFAGNIVISGTRHRSRLVWNDALNPQTWPAANYMDLDIEDGDEIKAIWGYKDILVVFKRYKTYIIKYVGGVTIFDWERIDSGVGCVGPNAICEEKNILYFIGDEGFYMFDGTVPPKLISTQIERSLARFNLDIAYTFEVDNYELKNQLFFNVAEGSSTRKNRIYIYDTQIGNFTKWSISVAAVSNIRYGSALMYIDLPLAYDTYSLIIGEAGGAQDTFLAMGSYDGFLQRFGQTENDLGQPLNAYWMSPWIDFGFPDRNKRITRAYVYIDSTGTDSYTLTFDIYSEWNDITPIQSVTFNSTGANKDIAEKRLDFTLPGRSFKFKVSISQANATVSIHRIIIDFLVKGRTLVS